MERIERENSKEKNFISNISNTSNIANMSETKKIDRRKEDLNFKKWLLSLSSIGNLILGALLVIMGVL